MYDYFRFIIRTQIYSVGNKNLRTTHHKEQHVYLRASHEEIINGPVEKKTEHFNE